MVQTDKNDVGQLNVDEVAPKVQVAIAARGLKFGRDNSFQQELKRRVDEFFEKTGRKRRDVPAMYLKSAILFGSLAAVYFGLVFFAVTWWQAVPLAVMLGLITAAIGFNVQHDGGHHAYSEHPWINKIMARSLDLIGGSSYLWHYKHGVFHHTYVNITGADTDVDMGLLARLTPHQKRLPFHRFQHLYVWPLYGLMAIKWQLFDDFKDVVLGRIGEHKVPRPKGMELFLFLLGKATFFTMTFIVPVVLGHHSLKIVLMYYALAALVLGMFLSVVFQLAHCVEEAEFPLPEGGTAEIESAWAVHQVETTVDFARGNRFLAWLLGGLNFQIEHHLLPRICHVNFPALSKIVEQTCHDFGIKYNEHRTFWAGVGSHFRSLRQMGMLNPGA